MYPMHIVNQYRRFFLEEFSVFASKLNSEILKKLQIDIEDKRSDADIFTWLDDIKNEFGRKVPKKNIELKIKANFKMIDAWSRDKTLSSIKKMYSRLNAPQPPGVTGRPTPLGAAGELYLKSIDLSKTFSDDLINETVARNVDLIKKIKREHLDGIHGIVKNGLLRGESTKTINKKLMHATGVKESKAQLWADDQASKFFGETTRLKQTSAGIKGYIWRILGQGTRDYHAALEGTFHRWDDPPEVNRHGEIVKIHPGEDYRCKCWAEPATGPDMAERKYAGPGTVGENLSENEIKTRAGIEPATWGSGLASRVIIDINDTGLRESVNTSLREIDKILNLKIKNRAISISEMIPGTGNVPSTNVQAYLHKKSRHIAIGSGNPYKATSTIHEISHYIHRELMESEKFKPIVDMIKGSNSYKKLKKAYNAISSGPARDYLKYLVRDNELFVRAMEQYISTRSINPELRAEFFRKRREFPSNFWVDSDFEKIYIEIERIFKILGWLK
jgi:SPP1 gp7 family putative phage head morphogenesis protein